MPAGQGRRMYSRYDFKSGYGFFDACWRAGHYFDQAGAMFRRHRLQTLLIPNSIAPATKIATTFLTTWSSKRSLTKTFGALWSGQRRSDSPLRLPEARWGGARSSRRA